MHFSSNFKTYDPGGAQKQRGTGIDVEGAKRSLPPETPPPQKIIRRPFFKKISKKKKTGVTNISLTYRV